MEATVSTRRFRYKGSKEPCHVGDARAHRGPAYSPTFANIATVTSTSHLIAKPNELLKRENNCYRLLHSQRMTNQGECQQLYCLTSLLRPRAARSNHTPSLHLFPFLCFSYFFQCHAPCTLRRPLHHWILNATIPTTPRIPRNHRSRFPLKTHALTIYQPQKIPLPPFHLSISLLRFTRNFIRAVALIHITAANTFSTSDNEVVEARGRMYTTIHVLSQHWMAS